MHCNRIITRGELRRLRKLEFRVKISAVHPVNSEQDDANADQEFFLTNLGLNRTNLNVCTPTPRKLLKSGKNGGDDFLPYEHRQPNDKYTIEKLSFRKPRLQRSSVKFLEDQRGPAEFISCMQKMNTVACIVSMFHETVEVDPENCQINFNGVSILCKVCTCPHKQNDLTIND